MIYILILACLFVAYANGANDVSKGIATLVGSGVSNFKAAILWGTAWTVVGALVAAFLTQALVATFSGKGLLRNPDTSYDLLLAVSCGAIGWLLIATRTGMPVSTTHSLAGALVGAAMMQGGTNGVLWAGVVKKVAYPLILSPFFSLILLMLILPLLRRLAAKADRYCLCVETATPALATPDGTMFRDMTPLPKVEVAEQSECGESVVRMTLVDAMHWLSAGTTSFFRGVNDAPKIIALGIAAGAAAGISQNLFYVLLAVAMGAGSLIGGRRVTETLAQKVVKLSPRNGFAANLVTSILVATASRFALPVSTTHVSSGAIIGIGLSEKGDVRWRMVFEMILAWVVTLPASAIIAAIVYKLVAR